MNWKQSPYAKGADAALDADFAEVKAYGKARKTGDFLKIRFALALHSGEEPSARIGTDMKKEAEALLKTLQQLHPNLQYGKV